MALRELVLALEGEAEARLTAVRAEATLAADQLKAAATARLAHRRSADLAARAAEFDNAAAGAIDVVRRETAHRSLTARTEVLDAILARARALLAATAPAPTMSAGIRRDLDAALAYLGQTAAIVRGHPAWAPTLRGILGEPSAIRFEESEAIGPGLFVSTAEGRVVIDATLDNRLSRLWPELAIELLREIESRE